MQGDILDRPGTIRDIGFQGKGCALSKASFSIMAILVKGLTIEEALDLSNRAIRFISGENVEIPSQLKVFEGVRQFPVRVKCVTLAWRTLEDAFNGKRGTDERETCSGLCQ